jgi:hypothetical protein
MRTGFAGGPLFFIAIFGSACAGEPKVLAPREPPARNPPPVTLAAATIAVGSGRVVLHGTDGPMRITARADTAFVPPGSQLQPTRTGELCTTPCAVDLPVGSYKLYMTSADGSYSHGDTDTLVVREGLTYYVRAPGKFEPPQWIHVLPTVILTAGLTLALAGAAMTTSDDETTQTTGMVLLGGGIAVSIGGGVLAYDASRGTQQDGATTSWWVPPGGAR